MADHGARFTGSTRSLVQVHQVSFGQVDLSPEQPTKNSFLLVLELAFFTDFLKYIKITVLFPPILFSINTHSYKIAKFLFPLLRPISSGMYVVGDSFVQELLNLKFDSNHMDSFDITSFH